MVKSKGELYVQSAVTLKRKQQFEIIIIIDRVKFKSLGITGLKIDQEELGITGLLR